MPQSPLISVIDDDDSLRHALVELLESFGYRAAAFASAEAFLAGGQAAASDCIVTDIQMPGLSGVDLKHRLVETGVGSPVIMMTARTEPGLHQRAQDSGAVCLLRKPFTADALMACLDRALQA